MGESERPGVSPEALRRAQQQIGRRWHGGLGRLACDRKYISAAELEEVLGEAEATGLAHDAAAFGRLLVDRGRITPAQLEELLGELAGTAPASPSSPPPPPEVAAARAIADRILDHYVLVLEIGRGGMGSVWKSWDDPLHRWVAVKMLVEGAGDEARARFLREARTCAQVRHPNLVAVHQVGEIRNRPFLVMDLIDGAPLDVRAPLRQTVGILRTVAIALETVHAQGIVHRDLKPGNILVDGRGEPHIVDFGLAHLLEVEKGLSVAGRIIGTPSYMAPEQAMGRPDRVSVRTDIYALGAILYESMTGRPPHTAESMMALCAKVIDEEPVPPRRVKAGLPADLETICLKALAKEPERRYATAREFAEDLRRHLDGEPIAARPSSWSHRTVRRIRRNPAAALLGVGLLLAAVALAGVGLALWSEGARRGREREADRVFESARAALDQAVPILYRKESDLGGFLDRVAGIRPEVEAAVAKAPQLARGHFLLGRLWELEGWGDRAEASWRAAIRVDPDFKAARFSLGRLLLIRSYLDSLIMRAAGETDRRTASDPEPGPAGAEEGGALVASALAGGIDDEVQKAVAEGLVAYAKREPLAVREISRKGVEVFRSRPGVEELCWIGAIVESAPDKKRLCQEAIRLRPNYPLAWYTLGLAYHAEGDFRDALEAFDRALAGAPRFAQAHVNRGVCRYAAGDIKGALEDLDRAVALRPADPAAWFNRGLVKFSGRGDFPAAAADFTRVLALVPAHGAALRWRAESHRKLGDAKKALEDAEQAVRAHPASALAWFTRGKMQSEVGDEKAAEKDYTKAIELDPSSPSAFFCRAFVRGRLGNDPGATEDFRSALKVAPPDWPERATAVEILRHLEESREH